MRQYRKGKRNWTTFDEVSFELYDLCFIFVYRSMEDVRLFLFHWKANVQFSISRPVRAIGLNSMHAV